MRAAAYDEHGKASVLTLRNDYPKPTILPDQVLVKVHYAAINPCDFKVRRNSYPAWVVPKPKIPGEDVAGIVAAVGKDVPSERFAIGDRVAALGPALGTRWGTYAEFVPLPYTMLAKVPDNVSLRDAAAMPLVALTTIQGLDRVDPALVGQGKKFLVHAGSGGVGSFALQWASAVLGFSEVATTSSNSKLVRSLGATTVVNYRENDFAEVLADYHVVLDPMSYEYENRSLSVVASGGHYINILGSDFILDKEGQERGNGLPTFTNWIAHSFSRIFGRRTDVPAYSIILVSPNGDTLSRVMEAMETGKIHAVVDRVFPLADAAAAHEYLETGRAKGKVLLQVVQ